MHLLVRDVRSLDEDAPAQEPGQDAAPLVMLSFSDADLGALAAAWHAMPGAPGLRLASLGRLRHPMSVDLYLEQVVAGAQCLVVRLLGGVDYWRYGVEEAAALCRELGVALALLPGDGADDTRLRALSTVDAGVWEAMDAAFRAGGEANMGLVLRWAAWCAGLGERPSEAAKVVAACGEMAAGVVEGGCAICVCDRQDLCVGRGLCVGHDEVSGAPGAVIVFYRSHLLSADVRPVHALAAALQRRGLAPRAVFVDSLKSPGTAAWVAGRLRDWAPAVVVNLTAFSARGETGSPLDAAGAPVLQAVLSGSRREAWAGSARGLSPTDLAMQVVLPELDGRLLAGAVSFKAETVRDEALQYARIVHAPDADGVALVAARAAGWARLAGTARGERRLAVVLSDYPGIGGQAGHAVGLDTFASVAAVLRLLRGEGYAVEAWDAAALVAGLCHAGPAAVLTVGAYGQLFGALPRVLREAVTAAWGAPEDDPAVVEGAFVLRHVLAGNAVVALQPDRGSRTDRRGGFHDPDMPPRHSYIAFHLWLRQGLQQGLPQGLDVHAMMQMGAHGSLEWLPGKAAALSGACWPRVLLEGLPVVYPFIVNNPGEAAAAKRRLGAVVLGHLTPPVSAAGAHGPARALEVLLDEYAAADGLDRRRAGLLRGRILERAAEAGLLAESGVGPGAEPDEALARLDAYLCDVKDLAVRDGLHVFGEAPAVACGMAGWAESPGAERAGLLAALDGRFVQPGPAGAPSRGRVDVLPTGRNLSTVDPRAVPTPSAMMLAEKAAVALLRRHVSEQGEHLRSVVLDVWGSAAMRTGGEDLALAFVLLGARPVWDEGSGRVSGFEVLPLAVMDRPRVDVTLRVSGLFRDAFGGQVALFDQVVRAVAGRDEAADWNPLVGGDGGARALGRVYGPLPGQYGVGEGWLAGSSGAYGAGMEGEADAEGLAARVMAADAFVHAQDHGEMDVLDGPEVAAHEGGFAQAAAGLGGAPALYHLDTANPERPVSRTVAEEVVRVVRGRVANPRWLAGQMRHGYRGAAEMARSVAALDAYARSLPTRFDAQFDLVHGAMLGDADVAAFLREANPEAYADMRGRFAAAQADGIWHPRRNVPMEELS